MTISAFRIVKKKWSASAFDGEAAKYYPGRWNSRGTRMIYTASSRALAMLEVLVHVDSEDLIREHYSIFQVEFPDTCLRELGTPLPRDWKANPAPSSTKSIGDDWGVRKTSLVLAVPSVIVPAEHLYLINPDHADFAKMVVGLEQAVDFDPRLAR